MRDSQLNFIHLDINKKRGKLSQTLRQEVANANPARRVCHDPWNLCEAVLEVHFGTADYGLERRKTFSELSRCSQSCSMVKFGSQPYSVGIIDQHLCKQRSNHPGIGRVENYGVDAMTGVPVGMGVSGAPSTIKRPIVFQSYPINICTSY